MSLIFKCVCALSVIHDPKWAFKFRLNVEFIANLVSFVSEHKVLSFLVKESHSQHNWQGFLLPVTQPKGSTELLTVSTTFVRDFGKMLS